MDETAPRSSLDAVAEAYPRGLDWTLIRESLRRTPEERLEALIALARLADELRAAGRPKARPD
jgi:hypothetical protein